jgi:hypothetical protein
MTWIETEEWSERSERERVRESIGTETREESERQ